MSDGPEEGLSVRVATSLKAVPAGAWNACANPYALQDALAAPCPPADGSGADRDNPFVSHEFLLALEESRCIGGRSGWSPAYLLVEDGNGQILAAAPSFLKSHSQGEYVFDHGWADAYERAGGRYYPKLQVAAPFTPATGPRLLVADMPGADEARVALIAGLEALRAQGFPDTWLDGVSYRGRALRDIEKYRLVGNSWPVPVTAAILSRIDRHWMNPAA